MLTLLQLITPDWTITWDTKQIVEEIPGFEFKGAGWYTKSGSWMLIIPTSTADVFTIQVFYDRDPRQGFAAIAGAPIRAHDGQVVVAAQPSFGGLIVLLVGMIVLIPLSAFLFVKLNGAAIPFIAVLAVLWWYLVKHFSVKRERT